MVEPRLFQLDPLLDLGGNVGLELRLAQLGYGLGGSLLHVQELQAQVDFLLIDLLGRFLELGLLLHELALKRLGVEAEDRLALLHHRPLRDEEGDLELRVLHRGDADLRGMHRLQLALHLDRLHEVLALHRDRPGNLGVGTPQPRQREEGQEDDTPGERAPMMERAPQRGLKG